MTDTEKKVPASEAASKRDAMRGKSPKIGTEYFPTLRGKRTVYDKALRSNPNLATLLALLVFRSKTYGFGFPTNEDLCIESCKSERTVRYRLDALERLGYIQRDIKNSGGRFYRNIYVRRDILLENGMTEESLKDHKWMVPEEYFENCTKAQAIKMETRNFRRTQGQRKVKTKAYHRAVKARKSAGKAGSFRTLKASGKKLPHKIGFKKNPQPERQALGSEISAGADSIFSELHTEDPEAFSGIPVPEPSAFCFPAVPANQPSDPVTETQVPEPVASVQPSETVSGVQTPASDSNAVYGAPETDSDSVDPVTPDQCSAGEAEWEANLDTETPESAEVLWDTTHEIPVPEIPETFSSPRPVGGSPCNQLHEQPMNPLEVERRANQRERARQNTDEFARIPVELGDRLFGLRSVMDSDVDVDPRKEPGVWVALNFRGREEARSFLNMNSRGGPMMAVVGFGGPETPGLLRPDHADHLEAALTVSAYGNEGTPEQQEAKKTQAKNRGFQAVAAHPGLREAAERLVGCPLEELPMYYRADRWWSRFMQMLLVNHPGTGFFMAFMADRRVPKQGFGFWGKRKDILEDYKKWLRGEHGLFFCQALVRSARKQFRVLHEETEGVTLSHWVQNWAPGTRADRLQTRSLGFWDKEDAGAVADMQRELGAVVDLLVWQIENASECPQGISDVDCCLRLIREAVTAYGPEHIAPVIAGTSARRRFVESIQVDEAVTRTFGVTREQVHAAFEDLKQKVSRGLEETNLGHKETLNRMLETTASED